MKQLIIFLMVAIALANFVFAGVFSTTVRFNPSGWEDNGSLIRTLTDNPVNISGNVSIGGGFDAGGIDLTTLGNILLAGDILIVGDILTIIDQEINGSFLPTEDDKFNLGSVAKRWLDGFFSNDVTALRFIGELKDGFRNENFSNQLTINMSDIRESLWDFNNNDTLVLDNNTIIRTNNLTNLGVINATNYLDSSLVLWMQFNNNANDSSQYGNDGDPKGGVDLSKDVAEFDGVDDYIEADSVTNDIDLSLGSYSLWLKRDFADGVTSDQTIFSLGRGNALINRIEDSYDDGDNRFEFVYRGSGGADAINIDANKIPINTWTHIARTWDASGNTLIYINGVQEGTVAVSSAQNADFTTFDIGATSKTDTLFFNGSIDEVKIYSRALSPNEIQELYNQENKNYGHFNNIDVKDLNVTNKLNIEGESTFKDNIHLLDNKKFYLGDADDVSVEFDENNLVWLAEVGSPQFIIDSSSAIAFNVSDTLYVDGSNNRVGIGTNSPSEKLRVIGGNILINSNQIYGIGSTSTGIIGSTTYIALRTNSVRRLYITNDGKVGIGTIVPTEKLVVIGNVNITGTLRLQSLNISGYSSGGILGYCGMDDDKVWSCS